MAFVVMRPNGTWEARESYRTEKGPRSRTLATFRELTPETEERIASRASVPIDLDELRQKARRAGAPVGTEADRLAGKLLRVALRGERPSRHLRTLLADDLAEDSGLSHELERMKAWAGATPRDRGRALVDLLGVGDALPARQARARRVHFPRITSTT